MFSTLSSSRAFLILLVGTVCIGMGPILVRLSETGPTATAFWRCFLAVPFCAVLLRRGDLAHMAAGWRPIFATGAFFAADLACWHISILWTTVANATVMSNLAPFVVAFIVIVVRRTAVAASVFAALAVAACGTGLLVWNSADVGGTRLPGDLMGMLTAVFYGSYLVCAAGLRARYSTIVIMLASSAASALCLLPLALLLGEQVLPATAAGWAAAVSLAVVSQVLGQGLIVFALAYLPVVLGTLGLLFQPVVSAAAAWVLFNESLSALELIGSGLTLIAIAVARSMVRTGAAAAPVTAPAERSEG